MNNFKVSVVIPAYNEADSLPRLIEELVPVLNRYKNYEIIIVNDGSRDETENHLRQLNGENPHIQFISLSRNFGHQYALKAGLDAASGDCVISMDADLQHPPLLIPELIAKWQEGYDIVYTLRQDSEHQNWFKRITSRWFYRFFNFFSGLDIPQGAADFRLLDRKVVDIIKETPEKVLFLRGYISWLGFKATGISYQPAPRFAGVSHYTFSKMLRLAIDGITSFSTRPLRLAVYLGLLVTCMGLLYGTYALYSKFYLGNTMTGWTSLMLVILILGGTQLFIMGILGEYIGTIFIESKKRPNYIIADSSFLSSSASKVLPPQTESQPIISPQPHNIATSFWTLAATVITILLTAAIFSDGAWLVGDDYLFMEAAQKGTYVPLITESGRFYPFGFAEFSLLHLWPGLPSIFAYNLVVALFFILTLGLTFRIYRFAGHNRPLAFFFWLSLLFTPAFMQIFMNIVYPEKMVIFTLTLFIFFFLKAVKTDRLRDYIIAGLAAVYATYCKEPVFGVFIIIALTMQIFNSKTLTSRAKGFNIFLVLNGIVFLCLYYFLIYRQTVSFYNQGLNTESYWDLALAVANRNKMFYLFALLGFWRLISLLTRMDRKKLAYDALLFSSLGYFAAYIILKLQDNYYFTPVYVLAFPALIAYLSVQPAKINVTVVLLTTFLILNGKPFMPNLISSTHQIRREHIAFLKKLTLQAEEDKLLLWYQPDFQSRQALSKLPVQRRCLNSMINYKINKAVNHLQFTREIKPPLEKDSLLIYPENQSNVQGREAVNQAESKGQILLLEKIDGYRLYGSAQKSE